MLDAMYTTEAKQAGKLVFTWMHGLDREWLAFSPCNVEAAAYDIALQSEGTTGAAQKGSATVASELEKGVGKVRHIHLNTVCKPDWTTGVLAGRPIAMGAICLAIIQPMGILATLTTMKMYVDDFTTRQVDGSVSAYEAASKL